MVSDTDSGGNGENSIYDNLSNVSSGFYEGYSLGKNTLGATFPERARGADSYGGNSIYGTVDAILSKYHWTYDYLLWGVSWANVLLMMADAQRTDYESSRENKAKSGDNDVLDLSDPKNIEKLRRMAQ